jgi:hypothetical protein
MTNNVLGLCSKLLTILGTMDVIDLQLLKLLPKDLSLDARKLLLGSKYLDPICVLC